MDCTPFVDLQSQTLFGVQSGRIGAEEVINDTDGKEAEELDELLKEEAAKTHAILLEMVRWGSCGSGAMAEQIL